MNIHFKITNRFLKETVKSKKKYSFNMIFRKKTRNFDEFKKFFGVRVSNIQPLFWNNAMGTGYYSEDDLPSSINFIEELKNKWVVYFIIFLTNGGIAYIGSSGDFGERFNTHAKDARDDEKKLYELMRKENKFLVKIVDVFDNEEEARKKESEYIQKLREIVGNIVYHQNIDNFKETEIRELIKPYMCNISKNTKHG